MEVSGDEPPPLPHGPQEGVGQGAAPRARLAHHRAGDHVQAPADLGKGDDFFITLLRKKY